MRRKRRDEDDAHPATSWPVSQGVRQVDAPKPAEPDLSTEPVEPTGTAAAPAEPSGPVGPAEPAASEDVAPEKAEPVAAPAAPRSRSAQVSSPRSSRAVAPVAQPAAQPDPEPRSPELTDPIGLDDLERGRTVALLAALGRVQLTLDLLERRVGRIEERLDRVEVAAGPIPAAPLDALREPAATAPADLGDGGVEAAFDEPGEPGVFDNDADAELPTSAPEPAALHED